MYGHRPICGSHEVHFESVDEQATYPDAMKEDDRIMSIRAMWTIPVGHSWVR